MSLSESRLSCTEGKSKLLLGLGLHSMLQNSGFVSSQYRFTEMIWHLCYTVGMTASVLSVSQKAQEAKLVGLYQLSIKLNNMSLKLLLYT
jgi:hypothetical protein